MSNHPMGSLPMGRFKLRPISSLAEIISVENSRDLTDEDIEAPMLCNATVLRGSRNPVLSDDLSRVKENSDGISPQDEIV